MSYHKTISYIKSGIRLLGCGASLVFTTFDYVAGALEVLIVCFAIAEVLGIAEETLEE